MEQNNRPRSRDKNQLGQGSGVNKRGSGLGTGPVGSGGRKTSFNGTSNLGASSSGHRRGSSGGMRAKGGLSFGSIILIVLILFLKGGNGGGSGADLGSLGSQLLQGAGTGHYTQVANNWTSDSSQLDTSVAPGARSKFTTIKGNGQDIVTIMVYLCGTDLESKSAMATKDLQEMMNARVGEKVNLIVYTGGCKGWKNELISSDKNQIYQIRDGKIALLEKDMGSASMTKASTLTEFIKYCKKNFPADRNELILWDHGGGSLSGYGYDEKNANSGSMVLAQIDKALTDADMKFDFIGFDACLMATLENGLMLSKHADYMIASEETEPGVGWYYTDWLTNFSKDTSMATINVGKDIVDGFIDTCDKVCAGQKTTLSVVDLAELAATVPDKLTGFATATKDMIQNDGYQTVSNARNNTREFAQSSKIDQVDLVHLAQNIGNSGSKELENAVKGAVKYNRTASCISNANGLSIYFPYKKVGKVDTAVSQYNTLGMDSEYTKCIKEFASVEATGQSMAADSYSVPGFSGQGGSILTSILSGMGGEAGLDLSALSFLTGRNLDSDRALVSAHSFDASKLVWTNEDGHSKLKLSEAQWSLIQSVDLSLFYDDGEGYIDLGLDNVYDFDAQGNLIGDFDGTWLSINRQPVAYYHLDTVEEGSHYAISGYVPAFLNGERVELILVFDDSNPNGYIAGAKSVYANGETETTAKSLTEVKVGDKLEFICDYYSYDGTYSDSYLLGDPMTIGSNVEIGNVDIEGKTSAMYRLTDIYNMHYWTPEIP